MFQANTKSRRNFPILRGWISPHFHESWSQLLPFEYTFHTQNFIFRIWHMVFWCRTEFQTGMRGVKDKLRASPHVKELNQKTIYEINLKFKVCSTDIKSQWSIMILYKRILSKITVNMFFGPQLCIIICHFCLYLWDLNRISKVEGEIHDQILFLLPEGNGTLQFETATKTWLV